MPNIETRRESERGCGFRKAGGIYLVCDGPGRGCGRIPFPLKVCPTCNQGIKPSRGWTWVDSQPILEALPPCSWGAMFAQKERVNQCEVCPMRRAGVDPQSMGKVGLIWVGEKFYPTPDDFQKEADKMGISRRIPAVPNGFQVGKTWVWLAHRKCIEPDHEPDCATKMGEWVECDCEAEATPGVFHVFLPTRIEYVVKEDDAEEKLDRMEKRGITLIRIEKIGEQRELTT